MAFTSITITAPFDATPGNTVNVSVTVTALAPVTHLCALFFDNIDIPIGSNVPIFLDTGQSVTYKGSFIMPSVAVILTAKTLIEGLWEWVVDATATKVVRIYVPPVIPAPEFSGFAITDYQ